MERSDRRQRLVRLATTSGMVAATTMWRTGRRQFEIALEHAPTLYDHVAAARADTADSRTVERSMAMLRDEWLVMAREMAEAMWQEARRGLADLDAFTREDLETEIATRPWRVKP